MALVYRTTYETYFRKHPLKTRKLIRPTFEEFEELPAGGNWLETDGQVDQDPEVKQRIVDEMYNKRLISTYTVDYCRKPEAEAAGGALGNQIVEDAKKIFRKADSPVLGPLVTARRVFGYMNPENFRTSLTTYQDHIGRNAYRILDKRNYLPETEASPDNGLVIYLDNRTDRNSPKLDRISPCCVWNLNNCC